MALWPGVQAVAHALYGASALVRSLRKGPQDSSFEKLLASELAHAVDQRSRVNASAFVRAFVESKDADHDGRISLVESGLRPEAFRALDRNGDGMLQSEEVRYGYEEYLSHR